MFVLTYGLDFLPNYLLYLGALGGAGGTSIATGGTPSKLNSALIAFCFNSLISFFNSQLSLRDSFSSDLKR